MSLCQYKAIAYAANLFLLYQCHQVCVSRMSLHRDSVYEYFSVTSAVLLEQKHGPRWIFFLDIIFPYQYFNTKGKINQRPCSLTCSCLASLLLLLSEGKCCTEEMASRFWQALRAIPCLVKCSSTRDWSVSKLCKKDCFIRLQFMFTRMILFCESEGIRAKLWHNDSTVASVYHAVKHTFWADGHNFC